VNLLTCACKHCGGNIEFDQDYNGLEMDCPHCGGKTLFSDSPFAQPPRITNSPASSLMACPDCAREISRRAVSCPHCGSPIAPPVTTQSPAPQPLFVVPFKSRGIYIILGLLLGGLGIHNFYAGRNTSGLLQLLITILTGWLIVPLIVVYVWIIVELFTVDTDGQGRALL
jgi:TM2 domain-containing membrane protein YozV/DNA-directed RNA polymerase subunit RPC12/RpoP